MLTELDILLNLQEANPNICKISKEVDQLWTSLCLPHPHYQYFV